MHIVIMSERGDLHALVVQKLIRQTSGVRCDLVETDALSDQSSLEWSSRNATVLSSEGFGIDIGRVDVIWARRLNVPQRFRSTPESEVVSEIVARDCRESLAGILDTRFRGRWVNEPVATRRAENKIVQLEVAKSVGFRIPRTLISQDPDHIRAFCATKRHAVVLKPVKGTPTFPILTTTVTARHLRAARSMRVSPTIYQEYIEGREHLRVHCFGKVMHAISIESELVDWRQNINVPFRKARIDTATRRKLLAVLHRLKLKMGVFDFKRASDGEPVWLEVNPQGQFLFAQALGGVDLGRAMARFLFEEAARHIGVPAPKLSPSLDSGMPTEIR
jgi:hypothetical protein